MLYTIDLEGSKTTFEVDVYGYFTKYVSETHFNPSEGGYFEIQKIMREGKEITGLINKCKGLTRQIEQHIEENYDHD